MLKMPKRMLTLNEPTNALPLLKHTEDTELCFPFEFLIYLGGK